MSNLVGKSYFFEDGSKIEIIQIKDREDGPWLTYLISTGNSLPRKLVMRKNEFMHHYEHLFPDDS